MKIFGFIIAVLLIFASYKQQTKGDVERYCYEDFYTPIDCTSCANRSVHFLEFSGNRSNFIYQNLYKCTGCGWQEDFVCLIEVKGKMKKKGNDIYDLCINKQFNKFQRGQQKEITSSDKILVSEWSYMIDSGQTVKPTIQFTDTSCEFYRSQYYFDHDYSSRSFQASPNQKSDSLKNLYEAWRLEILNPQKKR